MDHIRQLMLLANENRTQIINMIYKAKAGHPGGSLSVIDMLTAIYETEVDLAGAPRTKVVLSKGHAVPAQYAILYKHGLIAEAELATFRAVNSRLQGHPYTPTIPQTDATTGLLGQGLSIGIGMAVAKKANQEKHRVFVIVGDGELHEGQIWEGALQAPHYRLNNLVLVVDYNKLSSSGSVNEVIGIDPLGAKFEAFGWAVREIDGHDMQAIVEALQSSKEETQKPTAIICHTVKGKGVSFMENNPKWHSSSLTDEEYARAIQDLQAIRGTI